MTQPNPSDTIFTDLL